MEPCSEPSEESPLLAESPVAGARAAPSTQCLAQELHDATRSFTAVLKPVALTMALASIVVTHFKLSSGLTSSAELDTYTVYDTRTGGTSSRIEKGFLNSLAIVGVLAAATFGIVCLYKFRCMKVLIGYMMLSSVCLLGLMGGVLVQTFLVLHDVPMDAITFFGGCANFAVTGVVAIFYQTGVQTWTTQGYLVATAVLMAWQLSKFEEWTGWCLLVTLALYDLCAVLTPCGPLKALVTLMQERQEPMPGLLYEATLERDDRKPAALQRGSADHTIEHAAAQGQSAEAPEGQDRNERSTIKLGLGDFVFYSVLVSKAALCGFAACSACFLVIVLGLGATLVLLSVFKMALPALPISISLGVVVYFCIRAFVIPMIEKAASMPMYF